MREELVSLSVGNQVSGTTTFDFSPSVGRVTPRGASRYLKQGL